MPRSFSHNIYLTSLWSYIGAVWDLELVVVVCRQLPGQFWQFWAFLVVRKYFIAKQNFLLLSATKCNKVELYLNCSRMWDFKKCDAAISPLLLHSVMMVIYMGLVAGALETTGPTYRRELISHWPHQHHPQTDRSSGSKLDHNILVFCLNKTENKKVKIWLSIKDNGDRHSITLSERKYPAIFLSKYISAWNNEIITFVFKCSTLKLFFLGPTAIWVYYC